MHRRLVLTGLLALAAGPARAENRSMLESFKFDKPGFAYEKPFVEESLVIQVSDERPGSFGMVLNNVQNVMAGLGADKVRIVVVTYGPGLKLLTKDSPEAARIAALDAQGVEFDACWNTMQGIEKATGKLPELIPAAVIVPAGVTRIMQLQKAGFLYLRP